MQDDISSNLIKIQTNKENIENNIDNIKIQLDKIDNNERDILEIFKLNENISNNITEQEN